MNTSLKLGRIAGVPVGVNWSVLATVALVVALLGINVLPDEAAGDSPTLRWIVAAVVSVLFFASLLAHELMHAVTARRRHIGVSGITLWLLGGVTRMDSEPQNPKADLAVAAAGPITSLVIGGVFIGGAELARVANAPDSVTAGLAWVGLTNLVIGVFNLLPGTPLDGGRIMRALVWMRTNSRERASTVAARAGRVVGVALLALGFVMIAFGLTIGGIWMALLGWFLIQASAAEGRSEQTLRAMAGLRVRDVMRTDVTTAPAWSTVDAFVDRMPYNSRQETFPVVAFDGEVIGLVTLARLAAIPSGELRSARLERLSIPRQRLPVVAPNDSLDSVLTSVRMRAGLPLIVMEDGRLAGLVEQSDLSRATQLASLGRPPLPRSEPDPQSGITPPAGGWPPQEGKQ